MTDFNQAWICTRPKTICLSAVEVFQKLSLREKLYAHYTARASWHGSRIILRQVSPESPAIFDFILEIHRNCNGDWLRLRKTSGISESEMQKFLEYAAVFLGNLGNYYGHGNQKFIPGISRETLQKLSLASESAQLLFNRITPAIFELQPSVLGLPSQNTQSMYYSGESMTRGEVAEITKTLAETGIHTENTRLTKTSTNGVSHIDILQASAETGDIATSLSKTSYKHVRITKGDYSTELEQICNFLLKAHEHSDDPIRKDYITSLCLSLSSGDMEEYKKSQRIWVQDSSPKVETVFGFVEPYRDPCGARAEFEGIVGIVHEDETRLLALLIENADRFVRKFPWVTSQHGSNDKGPFEMRKMDYRNFTSLHTIAYCSSLVFPGINLPNYNDIRGECGYKNIMFTNSVDGSAMAGEAPTVTVPDEESKTFLVNRRHAYYHWVVFHELFGHGTGKLLSETGDGKFNFDVDKPPINPLTGEPIDSWYKRGQTWTSVFEDIATNVDECRAECIGAYLMSDKELLALCGYTDETEIKSSDLEYNMYQQLAIAGIRSLENFQQSEGKWGQAHSQGHFAIFQSIRNAGNGFIDIQIDSTGNKLVVSVDRTKMTSVGRPVLEKLLLELHIYRCTADVSRCRELFERLTKPNAESLHWREILLAKPATKRIFVQPNTVLVEGGMILKEYEPTAQGMIQSWAERGL